MRRVFTKAELIEDIVYVDNLHREALPLTLSHERSQRRNEVPVTYNDEISGVRASIQG